MIVETLTNVIQQNIGALRPAPGGWLKRNCMMCRSQGHGYDKRSRFGIQFNSDSIVCHCFNCGFSAAYTEPEHITRNFRMFVKQIGVDERIVKQIEFEIFKVKNKISVLKEGEVKPVSLADKVKSHLEQWESVGLPEDSYSLRFWLENEIDDENFIEVVNYAINRGITDIDNFYWCPSTTHQLNQRLIIPYFYKGKIMGFTARLCYDPPDKTIPKYYQQCPRDFVYNLDSQADYNRKYIILTEGVLDGYFVDGVAILGEISQEKIDIINQTHKEIIVCPDRDNKGGDLVKVAIKNNWKVAFPKWEPGIKDAAAATQRYGKIITLLSILETATTGKERIEIKWKIESAERQRRTAKIVNSKR